LDDIAYTVDGSDCVVSSSGVAIMPGHDPSIADASTSIWGIAFVLGYAAPSTGLAVSIDHVTPSPSCFTPAMGAYRALSSICYTDVVSTTGNTTLVGAVVAPALLLPISRLHQPAPDTSTVE
jgi:hypothetical protein